MVEHVTANPLSLSDIAGSRGQISMPGAKFENLVSIFKRP